MNRKQTLTILILITLVVQSWAQDASSFFSKADTFFNTYVENGKLAYSKIKTNPDGLNELVDMAKTINISKSDAKTYQAFWINGYNLSVIKGIVDNYPLKSPLDVAGFFDKTKHDIGGKQITLNDIENKLLTGKFSEGIKIPFCIGLCRFGLSPNHSEGLFAKYFGHAIATTNKVGTERSKFCQNKREKSKPFPNF